MSIAEITRLSQPILKLSRLQMLLYSYLPGPKRWSISDAFPLALQALYFWLDLSKVTYYLAMIPGTVL